MKMLTIELRGQTVILEPPQRLVMLEITRKTDGAVIRVIHESGHESDDEFKLISSSAEFDLASPASSADPVLDFEMTSPLSANELAWFTLLSVIDVWTPPPGYKCSSEGIWDRPTFQRGESYLVFVLSEMLVQMTIDVTG